MKLRQTTKMAYQAAMAVFIAELISLNFYIDRGYWVTLTAMALTMQTWGESIKNALERVGMTVLGGVVGTMLYFVLPNNPVVVMIFLLVFVFFAVYTMQGYHLFSIFFLTCFVVFLFALVGNWNFLMLRARILDTALGALIAVTVGFFFFSLKTNIVDLLLAYFQKTQALMTLVFSATSPPSSEIMSQQFITDFQKTKKQVLIIRYEMLFHRLSARDFHLLINKLGLCTLYVTHLIEAYQWVSPHLSMDNRVVVGVAMKTTQHNLKALIQQVQDNHSPHLLSATKASDLLNQAIAQEPLRFATLESDALGFFNLVYFFSRLNTCLHEISVILEKIH